VKTGWPSVRVEHVESSGVGDAAEVGALLSVRTFVSLGELTPDDVHVQVLHGKIDSNDVLTGVTVRVIPRNDLLTSVAELGVVAVA
jgi:starch phosphorylase